MADKNPPAFPYPGSALYSTPGMTLRDYFAGQALATVLVSVMYSDIAPESFPFFAAERAYEIADAMLSARSGDK